MSLGIHIYTHSFSGLPNLKFRLRPFFWMPAPTAICVQYLATCIFHSCFKIHTISFLSPPSLSLVLPVLLMESSLAPKLEILNSLPLVLHSQPRQLLSVAPQTHPLISSIPSHWNTISCLHSYISIPTGPLACSLASSPIHSLPRSQGDLSKTGK